MKINSRIHFTFIVICLFLIFFSSVSAVAAEQKTFTVINTKDWQSLYLSTIYSGFMGTELLFFNNLADSQIKTNMMTKGDNILILESRTNPVIKNYESFLF